MPDFYIPDWETFVEIKPATEEYISGYEPCRLLSQNENNVLLICGKPWEQYKVIQYRNGTGKAADISYSYFARCRKCDHLTIVTAHDTDGYGWSLRYLGQHSKACHECDKAPCRDSLAEAQRQAQQAQFEYINTTGGKPQCE